MATKRTWLRLRNTVHSPGACKAGQPVAVFDFDSTLRPFRGRGPETGLSLSFLTKLSDSFTVVVVTNRDPDKAEKPGTGLTLKQYVERLDDLLGEAAVTVYASTAHDRDRKPHTGTWEHFVSAYLGGDPPRFVVVCGDAAGRPGDHSNSDYAFAHNIGAQFITPENLFFGSDPWRDPARDGCKIQPAVGLRTADQEETPDEFAQVVAAAAPPGRKKLVVLVGSPASGKTRIALQLENLGFRHISRDRQGDAGHRREFSRAIADGSDIVVDNTSPLAADRAQYLRPAAGAGYWRAIAHVTTDKETCFHLNSARCQLDTSGRTPELAAVVIHTFWKRLEPPAPNDEADVVIEVPFRLDPRAPREVADFRY